MRSNLISVSPYLGILAHRFLRERSGKPIPSWRASSSRDVGGGGGAVLPSFARQAGRGRLCYRLGVKSERSIKYNLSLANKDVFSR